MKVLLAMPIVRGQTHQRVMDAMYALEWDGRLDILLLMGGDDPETRVDNIVRKYNVARDVVLANGYDALMTLESDIIAPPDALKKLVEVDADVAYGLYVWQSIWHHWSAYRVVEEVEAVSISEDEEGAKAAWGKVVEVVGLGNGCTLIHRRVLSELPFRKSDVIGHPPDRSLAIDCQRLKFVQKCDLSVICGHIQRNPVPMTLWPDITRLGLYRATDVGAFPDDLKTNKLIYFKGGSAMMKLRLIDRYVARGRVIKYPGEIVEVSTEQGYKLIQRRIAKPVEEIDQPYETTAEYAQQMLKQRVREGGCKGCPK